MTEDLYATLGIAPKSEAVEIRAAYLALMRRFHPDRNESPDAIERAHAIIAAFAVLGNVEKRLHYDWGRRRAAEAAAAPRRRLSGMMPKALIVAALVLIIVPLSFFALTRPQSSPPVAPPVSSVVARNPVQIADENAIAEPPTPEIPVAAPQPTAIVDPPRQPSLAAEPVPDLDKGPLNRAPREPRRARSGAKPAQSSASTKAHCRAANPGAEAAVCNNDNLSALDRNVVAFYNQSLQFGAATKRGALLDSRVGFLLRREECRSDDCLQAVHLNHLRELVAIVEKRESEPPR